MSVDDVAWYDNGVKGIAAVFLVAVISLITGCAASKPQAPATPVETEYAWTDFHNGQEPASVPPVAKNDEPAPKEAAKEAKSADGDAVVEKTVAADTAEEAPKHKKKRAKGHRKTKAVDGTTPVPKPKKRKRTKTAVAVEAG